MPEKTKKPNPGSEEAVKQKCSCPTQENHYGEGCKVGKNVFFVTSGDCPLHGDKTKIERPDCFDFDDSEPQEHKKRRKGAKKCS